MAPSDSPTRRFRSRVRRREAVTDLGERGLPNDAIACAGRQTPRISVLADKWGQEWTISVRDRGIGIDPMGADRVSRCSIDSTAVRSTRAPGSGTLRHCIVERHGAETATGTTIENE